MRDLKYELLSATLDQFNTGVILLFETGEIIHTNSIADDMLAERSVLQVCKGHLRGKKTITTSLLRTAMTNILSQSPEGKNPYKAIEICVERASAGTDAVIGTFRLLTSLPDEQPVIALFLTKRETSDQYSLAGIAESYALTRAETRTLEQIACGRMIADAAKGCVVSKNTVKTHLQKIFEKTGTSRQTDLLRLVYAFRTPLRTKAEQPFRM